MQCFVQISEITWEEFEKVGLLHFANFIDERALAVHVCRGMLPSELVHATPSIEEVIPWLPDTAGIK